MSRNVKTQIAFVSTYPPRQCGLATFTQDLIEAIDATKTFAPCHVVAITNNDARYLYDHKVKFEIQQDDPTSYIKAAEYLNSSSTNLVVLEHEFGIFGGKNGKYVLQFLQALRKPVITTFHTVLRFPGKPREQLIQEISRLSDAVVVMAETGIKFLTEIYGVPREKLYMIHHGVPPLKDQFESKEALKQKMGWANRKLLCTFGLINPGKGIEYVLLALPKIIKAHPEVLYLVLGETHPTIRKNSGEFYRQTLMQLVDKLSLWKHVWFASHYMDKEELLKYLKATDIYITPYCNVEQICSGTLAYAVSLGKAIISTPYHYAREILAENRGILVEFVDPSSIAKAVISILDSPELQQTLETNARAFGASMTWPQVASKYIELIKKLLAREKLIASNTFAEVKLGG